MSKIAKNTLLYTIGKIFPQATGFLLLPIYTNYMSPSEYGIVSSMNVLSAVFAILFTLGINNSIFRLYYDYETEEKQKTFLGTISISLFIISLVVLIVLYLFSGFVEKIYESIAFYPYYSFAILTSFFSIFSIIPNTYLQIKERAGLFVILSIIQFLINTGFVLWFVVVENMGAKGMLMGLLIGTLIMTPVYNLINVKIIKFKFNKEMFINSLSFSLPMIPGIITAWILNLSDRLFIERYFNLHDVGIYSLGYKIAGLILVFTGAFNVAYNPVFYKLSNSKDQISAKLQLNKYNNIYIIAIIYGVFFIVFFSKEAILLFLNNQYHDAYKIIPIISLAFLISQITAIFNLMIYQNKKVIYLMYVSLASAFFNIILNFILIPVLGAYGAAYSTLISFTIVFALSWWYARKCYYIPIKWNQLIMHLGIVLLIYLLFNIDFNLSLSLSLIIKIIASISIGFIVFYKYKTYFINIFKRS